MSHGIMIVAVYGIVRIVLSLASKETTGGAALRVLVGILGIFAIGGLAVDFQRGAIATEREVRSAERRGASLSPLHDQLEAMGIK